MDDRCSKKVYLTVAYGTLKIIENGQEIYSGTGSRKTAGTTRSSSAKRRTITLCSKTTPAEVTEAISTDGRASIHGQAQGAKVYLTN